jgi:hypothetical protein
MDNRMESNNLQGDDNSSAIEDEYYTPREVSERAVCRLQMIYNYMRSGRIPFRRDEATHHRYMIPMAEADAWIEAYQKRRKERHAARR